MQSERSVESSLQRFQSYPTSGEGGGGGGGGGEKRHRKEAEVVRAHILRLHEDTWLRHPRRQKSQRRPTSAEPFVLLTHLLFPDSTAQIRFLAVVTRIDRIASRSPPLPPFSFFLSLARRFSRARFKWNARDFPFERVARFFLGENRCRASISDASIKLIPGQMEVFD